jgi:predicted RNA-binding Zn ribbon-like protein
MDTKPVPLWVVSPIETLCLDFANTRYWRGRAVPTDELNDFDDLLGWCAAKEALPEILQQPTRQQMGAAFAEAIALREAIYRLFHAIAAKAQPQNADLRRLNDAIAAAPPRRAVETIGSGYGSYGWRIGGVEASAVALLTPVLWSTGDLLVSTRLGQVRHCANEQCQFLFLDDSKSANRRWCSMQSCGNRAKAHRHYLRKKGGAPVS